MSEPDLSEICRRHGASVLRRCRGILRDPDAAQDAAQEVFLTIMGKGHQYRGEADLGSWIYRVTTNHCLNRIRDPKSIQGKLRSRRRASRVERYS